MKAKILAVVVASLLATPALASDGLPAIKVLSDRGPVTNLPMPRYVSLKAAEGNARRGPSLSHRIDWVFKHRGMPLQVVAEHGHWRRVTDRDGAGGWVHYTLISGARTVLIEKDMAQVHALADASSAVSAVAEQGAIGRLGKCQDSWCRVTLNGAKGWMKRSQIWGLLPGERRQ